ncbi:MAG: sigma-70 family RNA polymerase sigma factor [Alphaproteobacteria bacterium]|nr:sigma-70 family RNA polymerase sigma factor [Alphaproteobacteria bacterium]
MKLNIFNGLPEYVRMTILSQIRRLLSTPLFSYEDKEDLTQELLLFYLKRFYDVPDVDEALVVHALKQCATNLLVMRYRRRDFLYSSLADFEANEDFSYLNAYTPDNDAKLLFMKIWELAEGREKVVVERLLQGDSLDQISREMHMHKKTIYKFFEKIRKKLK